MSHVRSLGIFDWACIAGLYFLLAIGVVIHLAAAIDNVNHGPAAGARRLRLGAPITFTIAAVLIAAAVISSNALLATCLACACFTSFVITVHAQDHSRRSR